MFYGLLDCQGYYSAKTKFINLSARAPNISNISGINIQFILQGGVVDFCKDDFFLVYLKRIDMSSIK